MKNEEKYEEEDIYDAVMDFRKNNPIQEVNVEEKYTKEQLKKFSIDFAKHIDCLESNTILTIELCFSDFIENYDFNK